MTKLVVIFIGLYSICLMPKNFPANAQDTAYFSREKQSEVKVRPFCENSPNKDFAPFVWNRRLFVTSSRLTSRNKTNIDPITKQPYLNIYAFDRDCNPVDLKFLPSNLNTKLNCGPISITRDTSLLVITKNYAKPNKEQIQNLYLAFYTRENNDWSEEKLFPFNNVNFSLQHPYFDDQNNTLYFSANLPGGYGKFDLYKSVWDGKIWSQPKNLGPDINSSYNEVFPAIIHDGGLIYTSDHTGTSGGLDLVWYMNNTRFLLPEPFNTSYDDFSFSFIDNMSGYFSSNRDTSSSDDNIYFFEIIAQDSTSFLIRVLDKETQLPVPNVTVAFKARNLPLNSQIITSAQGEGFIHRGTEDTLSVSFELKKEGYLPLNIVSGNFLQEADFRVITLNMVPEPAQEDTLIVIGIRPVTDYYIIIGSFKDLALARQKAEKYINDYDVEIIVLPPTKEGYVRISYGKYSTLEEAQAALKSVKSKVNPNAWIFTEKK